MKLVFPKDAVGPEREAHRRIAFSGAHNFRDLGGYVTSDGSTVKWGVLYRSDALDKLTARDLTWLAQLGLYRIIDFREDSKRAKNPDRLPGNLGLELIPIPIFDMNSRLIKEVEQWVRDGRLNEIDPVALLKDAYIQFVTTFTPQFKTFMQIVSGAQGKPVLFHCSAGKDRSGFAAAVLLRILGVPQETIMQDYLLSRGYVLKALSRVILLVRLTRGRKAVHLVEQLSNAKEEYLEAAFAAIEREYGSFDQYVRDGLGLDEAVVLALKHSLLEKIEND